MAPSSHSSHNPPPQRQKKRRWTREQLLSQLKMIGDLDTILPPTLPPSPPASRAASPAAGSKRKLDSSSDPDAVKRPRTNLSTERSQTQRRSPQPPPQSQPPRHQPAQLPVPLPAANPPPRQLAPAPSHCTSRSEPCEDGEVPEEPVAAIPSSSGLSVDVPIRRPKKGKISARHFESLHDRYHAAGRAFKYSGDARFLSSYPPSHHDFRPIRNPPHPGSLYHKHGGLISRLELMDALVCFTYSIWAREHPRRICIKSTWSTIEAFLSWCKEKWQAEEGISDAERAFIGLIHMIEGFIQGRKMIYALRGNIISDVDKLYDNMTQKIATVASTAIEGDPVSAANFGLPNGRAPAMLPSPSSTNSTPVNRDDNTPNNRDSAKPPPAGLSRQLQYTGSVPFKLLPPHLRDGPAPIPSHVMDAMAAVTEPITPAHVGNLKDLAEDYNASAWCIHVSQATLNLPIMRRCFPKTWARMMYSTLTPSEEHEPDIEDEEGELFWPDQAVTGEGLGWVCLMGKAMIMEFGKPYGYKGLAGVVPKPEAPGESGSGSTSAAGQPPNPRPSTSSGASR